MARKPDQTRPALHEDRKRLEVILRRAQENTDRTPERNRVFMSHIESALKMLLEETLYVVTGNGPPTGVLKKSNGVGKRSLRKGA